MRVCISNAFKLSDRREDYGKLLVRLRVDEGDDIMFSSHLIHQFYSRQLADRSLDARLRSGSHIDHDKGL